MVYWQMGTAVLISALSAILYVVDYTSYHDLFQFIYNMVLMPQNLIFFVLVIVDPDTELWRQVFFWSTIATAVVAYGMNYIYIVWTAFYHMFTPYGVHSVGYVVTKIFSWFVYSGLLSFYMTQAQALLYNWWMEAWIAREIEENADDILLYDGIINSEGNWIISKSDRPLNQILDFVGL